MALGALSLAGLSVWGLRRWSNEEPVQRTSAHALEAPQQPQAKRDVSHSGPAAQPSGKPIQQHLATPLDDTLFTLGGSEPARDLPRPDPDHPGHVQPHPLDETRARFALQRQLFSQVKSALHDDDFDTARRLLQQHDTQFAATEAWGDLREGYQLIADCKQYADAASRERGQRFVEQRRGSTLRRAVRRACSSAL